MLNAGSLPRAGPLPALGVGVGRGQPFRMQFKAGPGAGSGQEASRCNRRSRVVSVDKNGCAAQIFHQSSEQFENAVCQAFPAMGKLCR